MKRCALLLISILSFALIAAASGPSIVELKVKAQGGDASAQLALANAYFNGKGIQKNEDLAFKWYLAAAEHGNADAQTQVGYMYRNGVGVEQDKDLAANWYAKGAAQGNANARYNLAVAYYNGDGVGIDDQLSYAWFVLAKEAGDKLADEAVERAESEHAKSWVEKAKFNLARMVERGVGLPANPAWAAKRYLELAGDSNTSFDFRTRADVSYALLLIDGRGVERNIPEAEKHCENAARIHSAAGCACLGYLNFSGLLGAPDYKAALRRYSEAARMGDATSMYMLGKLNEGGLGTKQDRMKAIGWYTLASINGDKRGDVDASRLSDGMTEKEKKKVREVMMQLTR